MQENKSCIFFCIDIIYIYNNNTPPFYNIIIPYFKCICQVFLHKKKIRFRVFFRFGWWHIFCWWYISPLPPHVRQELRPHYWLYPRAGSAVPSLSMWYLSLANISLSSHASKSIIEKARSPCWSQSCWSCALGCVPRRNKYLC